MKDPIKREYGVLTLLKINNRTNVKKAKDFGEIRNIRYLCGVMPYGEGYVNSMGILDFFKGRRATEQELRAEGTIPVYIPEERLLVADLRMDGKPYVCVFNEAILELTPKEPFRWWLSLIMTFDHTVGEGMPDREDTEKMQDFIEYLCEHLAGDKDHPNAVFLGRVTGGGQTQAMWYVNNPGLANAFLQSLIESGRYPFHFEFVMEEDPAWEEAHFWLDPLKD